MTSQIGQAPQIQPSIIKSAPQTVSQKPTSNNSGQPSVQSSAPQNENFQKLAENILAARAAGETSVKPITPRGQVVDILV